ncbi:hypothetical protein ACIQPR_43210 [Streptomyces sp. NPDC091280]|uniref:hypothetical protein n=1 Tax=Streptomyces sp. NPDC091280 TaxID=3365984 RepID=UPI00382C4102
MTSACVSPTQSTDLTTRETVTSTFRGHAIPYLGSRPLSSFKPEHIRDWLSELGGPYPRRRTGA